MSASIHSLFVYGSLRKGFNHDAYSYITAYFTLSGKGKVEGELYDLGPYPAAIPAKSNRFIIGELYTIKHADEFGYAIAQLDDYEGVDPDYDQPAMYTRQLTQVFHEDGTYHEAWIYWYTGQTEGHPLLESGDVMDYLKKQ